jgi:phosphoglycolate phosphatase
MRSLDTRRLTGSPCPWSFARVKHLVLWDIDQTLVTYPGVGRELFAAALLSVTGIELQDMPDLAGKTDHELATAVLVRHGVAKPAELHEAFFAALVGAARAKREEMVHRGRALEGADAALNLLGTTPEVVQTVVTGNVRDVAQLKLSLFGLAAHIDFEVGGFGSESADRSYLVRSAKERAEAKYEVQLAPRQVVVIGDTPHDVAGALANGALAVGVTSGSSSASQLEAAGADIVLPSLADGRALLDAIQRMSR